MQLDPWHWVVAHATWDGLRTELWNWVVEHATWDELPGYIGALFSFASFQSRRMIPLRWLTIFSNVCFIFYGLLHAQVPTLFLHAFLLPLNVVRLRQMLKLSRRVRVAAQGDNTMASLRPHMKRRTYRAGDVLFHKGDVAHELYYIVAGTFTVPELGRLVSAGAFVGELGFLAPGGRRTQSLECTTDGELLAMSYDHVRELYFQNPDFGIYFLGLTTSRLFQNLNALEEEVAALRAAPGGDRSGTQ